MSVRERTPKSPLGSERDRERGLEREADRDNVPNMQSLNWQSFQGPKSSNASDASDESDESVSLDSVLNPQLTDNARDSETSRSSSTSNESDESVSLDETFFQTTETVPLAESLERVTLRNQAALLYKDAERFKDEWIGGKTFCITIVDGTRSIKGMPDLLTGLVQSRRGDIYAVGPPLYTQFQKSNSNPVAPFILNRGAFNCFYAMQETEELAVYYGSFYYGKKKTNDILGVRLPCGDYNVMRVAKNLMRAEEERQRLLVDETGPEEFGEFRLKVDKVHQQRDLSTWKEAWLTLGAALVGLHPHVYACADIRLLGAAYVMPRYRSLEEYLRRVDGAAMPRSFPTAVRALLAKAATLGLIMLDVKPNNMLVDDTSSTEVHTPYFIDLDAKFTALTSASASCVYLINTVMLLVHLRCRPSWGANVTAIVVELLPTIPTDVSSDDICSAITRTTHRDADDKSKVDAFDANDEELAQIMLETARHYTRALDGGMEGCIGRDATEITFKDLWEAMRQRVLSAE